METQSGLHTYLQKNVSQIIAENSANSGQVFGLVPETIKAFIHTYHTLRWAEFPAQHLVLYF